MPILVSIPVQDLQELREDVNSGDYCLRISGKSKGLFPGPASDIGNFQILIITDVDKVKSMPGAVCSACDELSIDAGSSGMWHYDGTLPLDLLTDANIARPVSFGSRVAVTYMGDLYAYNPTGSLPWTLLSSFANEGYLAYDQGGGEGLAIDFGTAGLWYFDGSLPMNQLTWADIQFPAAFGPRIACTYNNDLYAFSTGE